MAYAAATSLMNTILRLLSLPNISLVSPSREVLESALEQVESLQVLLPELDKTSKSRSRKRVNALDGEIREVVSKFEDVLESRVTDQLLSQSPSDPQERNGDSWIQFSIDLLDLKQDTQSFTRRVKELKIAYRKALMNMPEDDEDAVVSSAINFGGKKTKMVGFSDRYGKLKLWVVGAFRHQFSFIVIIGMGGIGKTTLANKIFEDPDVTSHYHCRAWVTVGRKYELKDMLQAIIAQVNCQSDQILAERDEDIAQLLKESLKGRRFLIVLDDVWDKGVWPDLESLIPDDKNGSQVLLTTRSKLVAQSQLSLKMRLLTKEESWDLLREKVFAEDSCPRQLEKVGKKIAEKCDGLPLTILAIAEILSTAEMTPEYWDEVAENRNSVFMDAYNEISKVLYPSYDYLPQYLKMCFICTGVFPQKYVIPRSKLINIWIAEEFLQETKVSYVGGYLEQLVFNTLLMVYQKTSSGYPSIKTCGVHSSLWHLCSMEARKNKSFHVLSTLKDALSEDINSQRRLCIHNNVLFGIKDAYNSLEDVCAATVRSLGCFGPYHPYQVPITFGLRLLRLLDALTIRFYEFPIEVLKLVQLRYLALTYNGNLPASISKLWNLQFLIVHPHLRLINSYQAPSYLPMEIWDMKELKHLQITGSDLPDPSSDTFLPNLSTLLDVSERTCTRGVLERIPNLKKLGIQIELRPDGTDELALTCFAHISCLQKLKRLKCIVINPEQRADIFASLSTPLPNFPLGIRRLTLSGLGYPWKEMSNIALLPKLEVLKLQNYAFRGPKWEIEENVFKELRTLAIEDTDLVQWKVGRKSFGIFINRISFKHCYNLNEIHWGPSMLPIELQVVDCNPLGLTCFRQIQINTFSSYIHFDAHSSWVDGEFNNQAMVYPWDI